MDKDEFIDLAMDVIDDNTFNRIPQEMHEVLQQVGSKKNDSSKLFIDIHTHGFTLDHLKSKGSEVAKQLLKLEKIILGKKTRRSIIFDTLSRNSTNSIVWYLISKYGALFTNSKYSSLLDTVDEQPPLIMILLMMDFRGQYFGKGKNGKVFFKEKQYQNKFEKQIQEIVELREGETEAHKFLKKTILPFFAIDPRNKNLYADFLAAFKKPKEPGEFSDMSFLNKSFPFFGVKIYPTLGYFPDDEILYPIYKICQEKSIPILTHCGGGRTHFSLSEYQFTDRLGYNFSGMETKQRRREYAKLFNAPILWKQVIKDFPTLRINFAHFGSNHQWDNFQKQKKFIREKDTDKLENSDSNHVSQALNLILNSNDVFADLSYSYLRKIM